MGRKSREKSARRVQKEIDVSGGDENKGSEIEKLYTVYEAAEIVRVHHETVRNWMKQGKLKYVTLTPGTKDKYRIKKSALEEIIRDSNS